MSKIVIHITALIFTCANILLAQVNYTPGNFSLQAGIDSIYSTPKKSEKYLFDALDTFKITENWEQVSACYNALTFLYYSKSDINSAKIHAQLSENIGLQHLEKSNSQYLEALNSLGVLFSEIGQHEKAIEYLKESIEINLIQEEKKNNLIYNYYNLALLYAEIADYKNAIIYFEKVIGISQHKEVGDNSLIGKTYVELAINHLQVSSNLNGDSLINLGISILSSLIDSNPNKRSNCELHATLYNICEYHYKNKNFQKVKELSNIAISIEKEYNCNTIYWPYELLGRVKLYEGEFFEANSYLERSISKAKEEYGINSKNFFISKLLRLNAEAFFAQGNFSKSIDLLIESEKFLSRIETHSKLETTSAKDILFLKTGIKNINLKARTLHRLFDQTQDMRYLDAALDAAQVAAELVEKSRQEIVTQGSKQKLAGNALEVYETGIQIALALHKEKGEQQYLERAFAFAESNKAILLLEAMNETLAKNYGGIPDTLLEQEKDQRINITFYEKEIYQERQKETPDEEKLKLWENQLFEYKQDYQALVKLLEGEFPEYYEMKYNTNLASLSRLQQEVIQNDEVLVEYFVGAETIYAFIISKESAEVIEIKKEADYEVPIFELRDAILAVDRGVDFYTQFMDHAASLYQLYVAPIVERFPANTKRILLVTDDALGYLPFEVLLRNHPNLAEDNLSFSPKKLDYFFEDYLINYHYSSTLLEKTNQFTAKKELQPLFAMAPSFASPLAQANRSCSSDELYSLHCSKDEANTIQGIYGGNIALGEAASKMAFLNQAPNYRILHLATHSCADEENPSMSQIYFNDGAISNYELFNLDLNAELAVLSACNTGSGKLVRGEGVMSLSKGFIHAGVPSTVMSLWAVDDCSTSKLMVLFYEFLKQGLAKDEALRQARLAYLDQADALNQHPYYWAPFIQMGNSAPIELPSSTPWWMWVAGIGIVGAGFALWNKNRTN